MREPFNSLHRWLSIPQAITYSGFSESAIRTAISLGKISTHEVEVSKGSRKKSIRIDRLRLDAWIEGAPVKNQKPKP